jgi:hypothetical protein
MLCVWLLIILPVVYLEAADRKTVERELTAQYKGKTLNISPMFSLEVRKIRLRKTRVRLQGLPTLRYLDLAGVMQTVQAKRESKLDIEFPAGAYPKAMEKVARLFASAGDGEHRGESSCWKRLRATLEASEKQSPRPPGSDLGNGVHSIGGEVTAPMCQRCPPPEHPEELRRVMEQGSVIVRGLVVETGYLACVQVVKHDHDGLVLPALEAVGRWSFEPARRNGVPVTSYLMIEVYFRYF